MEVREFGDAAGPTLLMFQCSIEPWWAFVPAGEDPDEHYRRVFEFGRRHLSNRTIYNCFWSANNYTMPEPVPPVETSIEYWYGELERATRAGHLACARRWFPQMSVKEFPGLEHAELVMMHPERFAAELDRFWKG